MSTVCPATARKCCTPLWVVSASRIKTLNSRRASRFALSLGDWRRSFILEGKVGSPFVRLVLTDAFQANLLLLNLTVKARAINTKHVGGFLFVSTGAL